MKFITRHLAFTLIELTIALALSVILLGGAMIVLKGISRDRARLSDEEHIDRQAQARLTELLRHDLASASAFQLGKDYLRLKTDSSLDPLTLERSDRPCQVTYQIVSPRSNSWLIRSQQLKDDPIAPVSKSLIVAHVTRLDLKCFSDAPQGRPQTDSNPDWAEGKYTPRMQVLSRRILLTVEFDRPEENIRKLIYLY